MEVTCAAVEVWRPAVIFRKWKKVFFDNIKEVSNLGSFRGYDGEPIEPFVNHRNAVQVSGKINGRSKLVKVSHIVKHSFDGPCPQRMEVCHNDGNTLNNRLDNLRYDTHRNNILDQWRHGTMPHKLTDRAVALIRGAEECYGLNIALARLYKVSHTAIAKIRDNKTWQHVKLIPSTFVAGIGLVRNRVRPSVVAA